MRICCRVRLLIFVRILFRPEEVAKNLKQILGDNMEKYIIEKNGRKIVALKSDIDKKCQN